MPARLATVVLLTRVLAGLLAFAAAGPAVAQHELTGELPLADAARRELVVVAGATGRSGRLIIAQLRSAGRFDLRALARDPRAAAREIGAEYSWVAADVTRPETLSRALSGATYVICAIGATERSGPDGPEFVDFAGVRNLVDAARSAGVRQFVLISSAGAGGAGGFNRWLLNLIGGDVLTWKARGEAALRASGLPYTIVRPGGLRDVPGGQAGLLLLQGDRESGDVSRADVASVVIATLGNPDAIGKTFELITDPTVPREAWRSQFRRLAQDAAIP